MATTQNFDFIDYKVQVEYIDLTSPVTTEYISRFVYLKEDPALLIPPEPVSSDTDEELTREPRPKSKGSRLTTVGGLAYIYATDVVDADSYPELIDYFYKTTNKSIDVLTVGDITDMSEFIASEYFKTLQSRCITVVVDSSLDDKTIDGNFTANLALLVTRATATATAEEGGADTGRLIIEEEDTTIRTSELLKFCGWFFNRSDFLGQITMRQLDYQSSYFLDYQGLSDASENKNICFGNQAGYNFVSSFFIGNESGMNYYRLEQVKRDVQNALLQLLTIRNTYDQQTIDVSEVATKNSINKHSFCNNKKTYIQHITMKQIPSEMLAKKQIPVTASFGFYEEVNQLVVQLYNFTYVYGV